LDISDRAEVTARRGVFALGSVDRILSGRASPTRAIAVRRIGEGVRRALVMMGSVLAALILVCGFGLWRLMQGPVDLDRLTPLVQQWLNRSGDGSKIVISGARLEIDRQTQQLDLQIVGLRISQRNGEPLADLPEMSASFNLRSLLLGGLEPTRLVVVRPVLRLVRDESGVIRIGFNDQDLGATSFADVLEQLTRSENPGAPFGLMRRLAVREATLVLDDRRTGHRWQADRVDLWVERDPQGLVGDLSLALPLGAPKPEFHASYRYVAVDRRLDINIEVAAFDPAALASFAPELEPLKLAQFPISGTVATRLNLADMTNEGMRIDLHFGKGAIRSELLPEGFLSLVEGSLRAVYASESGELRVAKLNLDLGGGSGLTVDGNITGITPAMIAGVDPPPSTIPGKLGIVLADVPVEKLESLWPSSLSRGGRRWVVANVHDGVLDQAAVRLDLDVNPATHSAEVVSAHGTMRYRDATVSYFPGLVPARKVSGTATLNDRRLTFTPTSGAIKSVQLTGGSLQITDLGAPVEWITIDLAAAGPIRDVLETIDAKPLHYAHDIKVDPARVAGRTEAKLHFKLPLLKDIKLDQVEYGAKASVTDAAIANVAMNRNLTDGDFTVEIARPGAHLRGNSRFDGVLMSIDADLFFKPIDGARARYRVAMRLDDEQRRRLDFDFLPDRIAGPIGVDVTYWMLDAVRSEAVAALDLRSAGMSVAEAGWKKPPGVPAWATLELELENERVKQARNVEVKAPGLDGRFALALARKADLIERVEVYRLVIADDDVSGSVIRRPEGGWQVDLRGTTLDLSQWLKELAKGKARQFSHADGPLQVEARLGRLILGPRREVRDVAARLLRDGADWRVAQIDGRFPNGRQLSLRSANEAGKHELTFRSDDLGSSLSLFDITDNIVGGQVTVTGRVSDMAGKQVVAGHIEGTDYDLVRAPVFARILSLPSLSGVGSMLAGSGIPFSTLRGDFAYGEDRVVLENLLAYGGAIGVTTNGVADLGREHLDLQGTIVPAYALNSIIGNVPVIGSLLMGGEGQGLFAASYRVTGSPADPQVSVNPLSALAPGFLRRLFQPNFGMPPPVQQSLGIQ